MQQEQDNVYRIRSFNYLPPSSLVLCLQIFPLSPPATNESEFPSCNVSNIILDDISQQASNESIDLQELRLLATRF